MNQRPTWNALWEFCSDQMKEFTQFPVHTWRDDLNKHKFIVEIENAFYDVEEAHAEEIDWAISQWKEKKKWPEVSKNTAFLMLRRFETAASFASDHFRPKTQETIFELPDLPVDEIAGWLITDWWDWRGRTHCAMTWLAEYEPD